MSKFSGPGYSYLQPASMASYKEEISLYPVGNTVFYMLCFCKMCYVAFLLEGICIDKPCCLVSLVNSGLQVKFEMATEKKNQEIESNQSLFH